MSGKAKFWLLLIIAGIGYWAFFSGSDEPVAPDPAPRVVEEAAVRDEGEADPTAGLPQPRERREPAPKSASGDFAAVLAEVDQLLQSGRADEAVAKLQAILDKNPDHERALEEMGMIQLTEFQSPDKAAEYFKRALQVNPDNEFALMELVGVSTHPERADEALGFLQKLQQENPDSAVIADGMGELLMSQGRMEEALPHLARSARDPRYAEFSYMRMASVHQQLGNFEAAVASTRRAILHQEKQIEERSASGQPTEMVQNDLARNQLDLADMLMRQGRIEEARPLIEQARRHLGDDWEVEARFEELRRLEASAG